MRVCGCLCVFACLVVCLPVCLLACLFVGFGVCCLFVCGLFVVLYTCVLIWLFARLLVNG